MKTKFSLNQDKQPVFEAYGEFSEIWEIFPADIEFINKTIKEIELVAMGVNESCKVEGYEMTIAFVKKDITDVWMIHGDQKATIETNELLDHYNQWKVFLGSQETPNH